MDSLLFYELLSLFFLYAFLGWCGEVSFHALVTGRFVNRGFLNGPLCPIYGIGVVAVVFLLEPVKEDTLLLFLASLLLTSLLELLTGLLLEKLFHARWWDYSKEPFHLGPYICLKFSLMWGFACVFVVSFIHPFVLLCIGLLPPLMGKLLMAVLSAAMAADCYVTVASVTHMLRRLEGLEKLAAEIESISDRIGERISESTLEVVERQRQGKARAAEYKDELHHKLEESKEQLMDRLEDVKAEFQRRLSEHGLGQRRILKAFPHLRSLRHHRVLQALRQAIHLKRR